MLHVLHRPGSQDARVTVGAEEGEIAVRPPWQCSYQRVADEVHESVKIKCAHPSGAVVGTLAICDKARGQADLAQLSIGVDGVAAYDTMDVSCSVP